MSDFMRHLDTCAEELSKLPLPSIHKGTGLPVWLLLCLVTDARERWDEVYDVAQK